MESGLVRYGDTVEGVIDSTRSVTQWKFIGQFGDQVQITMRPTSGSLIPLVRILDAAGDFVDWNENGGSLTSVPLPRDGEYTIVAARRNLENGTTSGNYVLNLQLVRAGARPTLTPSPTPSPAPSPTPAPTATPLPSPTPIRALYYGSPAAGFLPSVETVDQWTFYGAVGDVIAIQVESLVAADRRFTLVLTGPGLPAEGERAPQGALNGIALTATGTFTLSIGAQTGQYRVTLSRSDANGAATALPEGFVRYNQPPTKGTLNDNSPEVVKFFQGHIGDVVTISVTRSTDNLDPTLELLAPDGSSLLKVDDGGSSYNAAIKNYRLPKEGIYQVKLGRYPGRVSAGGFVFALTLAPPSVPPIGAYPVPVFVRSGTLIAYGDTINGHLESFQSQSYVFMGRAGDAIKVFAQRKSGDLEPTLQLVDNTTNETLYSTSPDLTNRENESLSVPLAHFGTYTLTIGTRYRRSGPQQGGDYRLDLNLSTPYTALVPDKEVTGSIGAQNPLRVYQFDAIAGQVVSLSVRPDLGSTLTINLGLLAPNGHLITFAASGDSSKPQTSIDAIRLLESGTYTVLVARPGALAGDSAGRFKLLLQVLPETAPQVWAPPTGAPYGGGVLGEFATQGSQTWQFSGQVGDVVQIKVERIYGEGTQAIGELLDPDGKAVKSLSAAGASGVYQLTKAGTYTVSVSGANSQYALYWKFLYSQPPIPDLLTYNGPEFASRLAAKTTATLRFAGTADDQVSLLVYWNPGINRAIALTWQAPDGTTTAIPLTEPALTSAKLNLKLPTTGTYQFSIVNQSATDITYHVNLQAVIPAPTATPPTFSLSSGQIITGTLNAGGTQVYRFLARAKQSAFVALEMQSGVSPQIQMQRPNGDPLPATTTTTDGYSTLRVPLPDDGQYTIAIVSKGSPAAGPFKFSFALINAQDQPTPAIEATVAAGQPIALAENVPTQGRVTTASESLFSFKGKAGDHALISLYLPSPLPIQAAGSTPIQGAVATNTAVPPFYATISVYGPDGNYIAEAASGAASDRTVPLLDIPLRADGQYMITVRGRGVPTGSGVFYLTVITAGPDATPTISPVNALPSETVQQATLRAGETTAWQFKPKPGPALFVLRPRPNASLRAQVDVYTREGLLEATASAANPGDEIRLPILKLSSTQEYRIVVRAIGDTSGGYVLYATGSLNGLVVFGTKNLRINALTGPDARQYYLQTYLYGNFFEAIGRSADAQWVMVRNPDTTQRVRFVWVRVVDIAISYGSVNSLLVEQPVS